MQTLSDAILKEDFAAVQQHLQYGSQLNEIDEYGFTPLIEAAIVNNVKIGKLLLQQGADPNQTDMTGGTALHWAAENNNVAFCKLLFSHRANPNAYTLAGQPALTMPVLRQQEDLKKIFIQAGANLAFAQDYINTKLLGHIYELVGMAMIVSPAHEYVEVDFEGFYLEVTLGLIADSIKHFQNHFASRQLRRFQPIAQTLLAIFQRATQLIKYQQYQVDRKRFEKIIDAQIVNEPLIIPVGYEGHAITFIKYHDIWVKCDRREDSRLYDTVMFFKIQHVEKANLEFIKHLMYEKQSDQFINEELDQYLGLTPITELKIEAQISGNCSWANVEACVPVLFFLLLMQEGNKKHSIANLKSLALNYFHRWREWSKDRMLNYCIQAYEEGNTLQKASKAEILAAILFQRCDYQHPKQRIHFERIMSILLKSPYEYLLHNYLKIYYYKNYTEEGKRFFEWMKNYKLLEM